MNDAALQELLDKQAISELLLTYARAIDSGNENLLRSVFHPESQHDHGFQGPSSNPKLASTAAGPADFVGFALAYLKGFVSSHHQLGAPLITISGNAAKAECYFTATQVMRAKGDPLASADAPDTEMEASLGGRYIDDFEKRDGSWKIIKRTGVMDWQRILPKSA